MKRRPTPAQIVRGWRQMQLDCYFTEDELLLEIAEMVRDLLYPKKRRASESKRTAKAEE